MILLLGASGYYGRTFAGELRRRGHSFIPLTRKAFDYTRFDFLFDYLRTMKPVFLINAASFCGPPLEAGCETDREQAMSVNALLPQMIARVCAMTKTTWGHVSSGSIYSGSKVVERGKTRVEKDLSQPEIRRLFEAHPEKFPGFSEEDEPNFSFRRPPCSFYSGTKALAEEAVCEIGPCYIWRLRLPFSGRESPCNLLCQRPHTLDDTANSLSHVDDCIKACLDLWEIRAPLGIYNVTNPGAVAARDLVQKASRGKKGQAGAGGKPPARHAAAEKVPRCNCILDVSKLLRSGVALRPVQEAVEESMQNLRAGRKSTAEASDHPA